MDKRMTPEDMMPDPTPPKKQGLFGWLRGRFFAGMVIAAPLAATYFILQFLITFIDNKVRPLLPPMLQPETYINYAVPGFGVLVLVIALTFLGAIAANLVGRSLLATTDRILSTIPIVRNVYAAIKQLTEVLANNQQASFDRVVMIEYPKLGSWCIGFVASEAKGEVENKIGEDLIGVFVPTTPNPTSGFLIYVRKTECIEMEMSVEEGAKMILTAGLVVPDYRPQMIEPKTRESVSKAEVRSKQLAEE
mgnify:CR=1 FL=1